MNAFNSLKFNDLLKNFDLTQFEKYFHELVDSWLQRTKLNYVDYSDSIELENWWELGVQFEELCKLYLNSDPNEFKQSLKRVDEKFESLLDNLLKLRKSDVNEYLMNKANNLGDCLLKDFDWSVKLSCSSDKLSKLNEPLCNLYLYLNQQNKKEINFEMNMNELNRFIENLELIQTKLDVYE